ncbi:MAG: 16S rRNA (cytosine(1402)-N(4))-methyltransferase RsmH, partial [Dehalococcoidia bacterium]|nr:16S rRNA (cytosine(1402)-N(4))-methyltransferase RsmH [Dehalococcoidia bacterium]
MSNDTLSSNAHVPVMVAEAMEALKVHPGGRYVDCTLGAGGHARAILERIQPGGRLLGIDADPVALETAGRSLSSFGDSIVLAQSNFSGIGVVCREQGFAANDGILFDLGVSSMQLDTAERGFSFQREAPLDMRFDTTSGPSAADIVNSYSEQELARILWEYGEERYSRQIAHRIVEQRPILSTLRLAH